MEILFFSAPWCGACKEIKPWAQQRADSAGVTMTEINTDEQATLAAELGIRGLPTIVIRDGVDTIEVIPSSRIRARLSAALGASL